jgi:outer membrane immunogenic protein
MVAKRQKCTLTGPVVLGRVILAGFSSCLLTLIGTVASAADRPAKPVYKAPSAQIPPARFSWTGFYIGGNAGGAWAKAPLQFIAGSPTPADAAALNQAGTLDLTRNAFVGGIQGGFNWQSGPVLIGIEIDYNAFRAKLQQGPTLYPYGSNPALTFNLTQTVTTNWLFTARPRIGFAANSAVIYATGGVAIADLHYSVSVIDQLGSSETGTGFSRTKTG